MGQNEGRLQLSRRALLAGLAGIWLGGCSGDRTPRYTVVLDRPSNRAHVMMADAMQAGPGVTVQIESRSGIGRLHFAWWTPTPPPLVTLELALTGLEHVALTWNDRTVSTAWTDAAPARATLSINTEAGVALVPGDADWPSLTRTADGRFLLAPPASFNAAAPTVWQLAWVDFYR